MATRTTVLAMALGLAVAASTAMAADRSGALSPPASSDRGSAPHALEAPPPLHANMVALNTALRSAMVTLNGIDEAFNVRDRDAPPPNTNQLAPLVGLLRTELTLSRAQSDVLERRLADSNQLAPVAADRAQLDDALFEASRALDVLGRADGRQDASEPSAIRVQVQNVRLQLETALDASARLEERAREAAMGGGR